MRRLIPALSLPLLVAAAAGHAVQATSTSEPPGSPPPADSLSGDVNVFAAASLTDAFTAIGEAFEAEHPDVDVMFNFAASSDLVGPIIETARRPTCSRRPTRTTWTKLVDAERNVGDPATFATNSLAIIVEPGNPQGIEGVEDLADPDLIVVATATPRCRSAPTPSRCSTPPASRSRPTRSRRTSAAS